MGSLSVFYRPQAGQEWKEVYGCYLRPHVKGCVQEQTDICFWNLDSVGCGRHNQPLRTEMRLFGFREPQMRGHQWSSNLLRTQMREESALVSCQDPCMELGTLRSALPTILPSLLLGSSLLWSETSIFRLGRGREQLLYFRYWSDAWNAPRNQIDKNLYSHGVWNLIGRDEQQATHRIPVQLSWYPRR